MARDLPGEGRRPGGEFDLTSLPNAQRETILNAGRAKFHLCSEEFVRERLAAYEVPRQIEFVADLPLTVTGKIRRNELRRLERLREE